MIGLILIGLLVLGLLISLAIVVWAAANEHWEIRAEQARIDSEVRHAERQLHGLTIRAFASMLDATRGHTPKQDR